MTIRHFKRRTVPVEHEKVKFPWKWILALLLVFGALLSSYFLYPVFMVKWYERDLYSNDLETVDAAIEKLRGLGMRGKAAVRGFLKGKADRGVYGGLWRRTYMYRNALDNPRGRAIKAALEWLARHQDAGDGRWDGDGFTMNCKSKTKRCGGEGKAFGFDVGITSLAVLAFLGSGHTHLTGDFKPTVHKALKFLLSEQDSEGCIGKREGESWFYNHAIALTAICEAYAMTGDEMLKRPAERALKFGLDARNPGWGWKYTPRGGQNDTSVTGWMVLALKAAEAAEFHVPEKVYMDARKWLDKVTASNGRTGYMTPGDHGSYLPGRISLFDRQETMTSVAISSRIFMGQSRRHTVIKKGVKLLMAKPPTYDKPNHKKVNYYYWYCGTYAMYQLGGKDWLDWDGAVQKALVDNQCRGGCADGSWDPVGEWCIVGGRAYATAINALTLEVYWRYKRVE
jgi:hypothetical protein